MAAQNWPTRGSASSETVPGTPESKNKLMTRRNWDFYIYPLQLPVNTQKTGERTP